MPLADYSIFCEMLDRARKNHFAYPAFNVTSLTTANAVLKGLAESKSDGIIQVSTGGAAFASGSAVKDMAKRHDSTWSSTEVQDRPLRTSMPPLITAW